MIKRVDLHNHTKLCNHASGEMEEFVLRAIERKIDIFGFSDHAPMNYDQKYRMSLAQMAEYEQEVCRLKSKYSQKIEILLGYEVDFLNGFMLDDVLSSSVDYFIGSVHFIKGWGFDNPEFIGGYKDKDINEIWQNYFDAIEEMAKTSKFDIVGHLDLIKVFNFLPTKDIKILAKNAIQAIKKSNMCIELNPAGLRKPVNEIYPSVELLQMCFEFEIPITFGSDAHEISQIGFGYDQAADIAKKIGYSKCTVFKNRDRQLVNF
jgi:histidinol-phosphatase (PHP family)